MLDMRRLSGVYQTPASLAAGGAVPKWLKGTVCKTVIHRFESGPRLHLFLPIPSRNTTTEYRCIHICGCVAASLTKTKKAASFRTRLLRVYVGQLERLVKYNVSFNTNLVSAHTTLKEVCNFLDVLQLHEAERILSVKTLLIP